MKLFKPVFDNFKDVFFDGRDCDPELGVKPKRGGAAAKGGKAKATKFEVEF